MSRAAAAYADSVFINCPFDADYAPIFDALVFVIFACRFQPRSALELEDGSQTRIDKLYGIIEGCKFGIHDLSRTELDSVHGLPRFNMPLELGVFLGAKRFGAAEQKQKRCLILDVDRYRYQRFVSDLAGMDIRSHGADVGNALAAARDWLANASRRESLPSAQRVQQLYRRFGAQRPVIARRLGFDPNRVPYVDYEGMVTSWLVEADPPAAKKARRKSKKQADE